MEAQYSVLLCNQNLNEYKHKISEWLHTGIKVLWFGNEADVAALKQEHPTFAKEFLLQASSINIDDRHIVVDGDDKEDFISIIEKVALSQ